MKAFLLAAGKGTRLQPLTNRIPKCLLPIKGTPLLGIWFALCRMYGITEILINLHHLSRVVENYLEGNDFGINITTSYEPNLLGSAGTILANKDFVEKEKHFFIIYGDNLTNMDLSKMTRFHEDSRGFFTLGLFPTGRPHECGIVTMDRNNIVTAFEEKPSCPASNLANAGIYVASRDIFNYIPHKDFIDFGFDVLPRIVGKMHGYKIEEYLIDIGNLDNYRRANREWNWL